MINIVGSVFGDNCEHVDAALSLPFAGRGATWDAINAYSGEQDPEWDELLEICRMIQKEESWGYVYVIKGTHDGVIRFKIGKANDLNDRLKLFAVKLPFDIETITAFYVPEPLKLERGLHVLMAQHRISGEWFDLNERSLLKIRYAGFKAEQTAWAACYERIAQAGKQNTNLPDGDYIEYLEALLAMNGIAFSRAGG